jgi:hypothetical protein
MQVVRHLGHREHVDQVEEQLDVGHPLLAGGPLQQAGRLMTPQAAYLVTWHHTHPLPVRRSFHRRVGGGQLLAKYRILQECCPR